MPGVNSNESRGIVAKKETAPDGAKRASIESHYYSAPLPPPEMMAGYERVVPGSADRIIKRFELQGDHRHKCEKIFIVTQSIKSIGGLIAGFIIAMTAILGGIYTALQGKPWLGGTLSFTGLAIIIGAFVTERFFASDDKDESEQKED